MSRLFPYYGGKANLAPWLIRFFPPHDIYVEPFCGSAAVLFSKPRSRREVISDLDPFLVNFLKQVRDKWFLLAPYCANDFDYDFFHEARLNLATADPILAARHYYATHKQSFKQTGATSSWDETKRGSFVAGLKNFEQASQRLKAVEIKHLHYRSALLLYDSPQTFGYLDPCYLKSVRNHLGGYRFDMPHDWQHLELLNLIRALKGKYMISGYPSPLYARELKGWNRKHKRVRSVIADQSRDPWRTEAIWMNF